MENEFDEVMRKRTDAELIKIVTGPVDDYQSAALEAAKREFERRNLSETEVTTVKQEIFQAQAIEEAKANVPLPTALKIFAFILPGIPLLMMSGLFKADGYDRKAAEMVKWTLYGFAGYVGFVILIILLKIFLQ
jgi:hypothetical protein